MILKKNQFFSFNRDLFQYFYHPYNATWANERSVEIPLGLSLVNKYKNSNILEVGNVLSHYVPVSHDIVDKYEVAAGVMNADVISFKTRKKYDLILSISTLEHVGVDELLKEPNKVLDAITNLCSFLNSQGELFFTVPVGYNFVLDNRIKNKKLRNSSFYFLKRISEENEWIQCLWKDVDGLRYGFPYLNANAVAICIIKKT